MNEEKKKILVVDDSALMRRVLCDIINSDKRFQVVARANDGMEAFDLLSRQTFDGVVLDINMPRMNGLELLKQLRKFHIPAKVMIASTDSSEGADVTLDALELGALDFIQKPGATYECRNEDFTRSFLDTLYAVTSSCIKTQAAKPKSEAEKKTVRPVPVRIDLSGITTVGTGVQKIVAIASSTGGPKALQSVIPYLPKNLDAPVVMVQHMPKGFTASLADRLNLMSQVKVCEAKEGQVLENGTVYLSMGGMHLNVVSSGGKLAIHYSDEAAREGVKPSANYMFESLAKLPVKQVVCVVMTGMGADGTKGVQNLKKQRKAYAIAQNQDTCVVYGMPKCLVKEGLADIEIGLEQIADEITNQIGVR